jgi:hypothetical protein
MAFLQTWLASIMTFQALKSKDHNYSKWCLLWNFFYLFINFYFQVWRKFLKEIIVLIMLIGRAIQSVLSPHSSSLLVIGDSCMIQVIFKFIFIQRNSTMFFLSRNSSVDGNQFDGSYFCHTFYDVGLPDNRKRYKTISCSLHDGIWMRLSNFHLHLLLIWRIVIKFIHSWIGRSRGKLW